MKDRLWEKRIPTLLGIGLVLVSIIITSALVKDQTRLASDATAIDKPQEVAITNISDTSFVLSYQTGSSVIGSISLSKDNSNKTIELEDLDKDKGSPTPRKIHYVTIKNLKPSTKYYFEIISGQTTYLSSGKSFEATTAPTLSSPPSPTRSFIKGKVILPNGNPPNETLAYLTIPNAQNLSTLLENDGSFNIYLNYLRINDLSSYLEINNDTNAKIVFINDSFESDVLLSFNKIATLPTITLSNNYDFTLDTAPKSSYSAQPLLDFSSILPSPTATKSPKISTP